MSSQEVTRLRKAGCLQEALAMAEDDLRKVCGFEQYKALFWCLYSKLKTDSPDEALVTLKRMEDIFLQYGKYDSLLSETYERARSSLKEDGVKIKDALASARDGNAKEAYQNVTNLYHEGKLDEVLKEDYGWIIYYALKQDNNNDIRYRKQLLSQYLKLNLEKPSILHSLILREAVRVENTTPLEFLFSKFLEMWGLENLRDDDWQRFKTDDGKKVLSTVEKVITAYVKEMDITPDVMPTEEINSVVDKALETFTDSEHLPRQKAHMLLKEGYREGAILFLKKLLLRQSSKFYLWKELADLVDDNNLRISLLCQSLSCENARYDFVVKIRLKLAEVLCAVGKYQEAATELSQYKITYDKHPDWNIKEPYYSIQSKIPSGIAARKHNRGFYNQNLDKAMEFVYSAFEETPNKKKVSGNIRIVERPDKRFGFVGDCYVHQKLFGNLQNNDSVTAIVKKNSDGKWSTLQIWKKE